jgi:hypothetical protein
VTIRNVLVDKITLRVPYPSFASSPNSALTQTSIAVGDLLYWDNTNKVAQPAPNRTDLGSTLANQEDFAALFLGVSADQRLSTETSTTGSTSPTGPGDRTVITEGVFDCDCASQTWEFGDLVGVDRNSATPSNYAQQVNKVSGEGNAPAIGYVVKREPSAVTKVRCFLSSYGYGWFKTQSAVVGGGALGYANFKNFIEGGDFTTNPWQRGTTFTGIANTLTYVADRWFADGGASSSISVSQQAQTDVLGFGDSLRWGRANTNTATIYLGQVLETQNCQRAQGQFVTLSFWAKAGAQFSAAGSKLTVQLVASTTAGNDSAAHLVTNSTNWLAANGGSYVINTTQVLTTAAVRYSFTALVPATCTQLGLLFSYAPTGTSDTTDTVDFYGVQLEIGGSASSFEHRPQQVELALCQRFFVQFNEPASGVPLAPGMITTTAIQLYVIPLPVQMISVPTVTVSVGTFKVNLAGTATTPTTFAAGTGTVNTAEVSSANTGQTAGQATLLQGGGGSGYVRASADL